MEKSITLRLGDPRRVFENLKKFYTGTSENKKVLHDLIVDSYGSNENFEKFLSISIRFSQFAYGSRGDRLKIDEDNNFSFKGNLSNRAGSAAKCAALHYCLVTRHPALKDRLSKLLPVEGGELLDVVYLDHDKARVLWNSFIEALPSDDTEASEFKDGENGRWGLHIVSHESYSRDSFAVGLYNKDQWSRIGEGIIGILEFFVDEVTDQSGVRFGFENLRIRVTPKDVDVMPVVFNSYYGETVLESDFELKLGGISSDQFMSVIRSPVVIGTHTFDEHAFSITPQNKELGVGQQVRIDLRAKLEKGNIRRPDGGSISSDAKAAIIAGILEKRFGSNVSPDHWVTLASQHLELRPEVNDAER